MRLAIATLEDSDAGRLAALVREEAGSLTGVPRPAHACEVQQWLSQVEDERRRELACTFSIALEGVGLVGIIKIGALTGSAHPPQLSYWVAPSYRCRGIATAAGRVTMLHAREVLGLGTLWSFAYDDNEASRKVLRRIGFRRLGRLDRPGPATLIYRAEDTRHGN